MHGTMIIKEKDDIRVYKQTENQQQQLSCLLCDSSRQSVQMNLKLFGQMLK